eukprot:m.66735 g.66735  ORF g.66735 m.66735 type:complete len:79 (-) comp13776_c0_seq2:135-371(-)
MDRVLGNHLSLHVRSSVLSFCNNVRASLHTLFQGQQNITETKQHKASAFSFKHRARKITQKTTKNNKKQLKQTTRPKR